jgi:hypothetical protein
MCVTTQPVPYSVPVMTPVGLPCISLFPLPPKLLGIASSAPKIKHILRSRRTVLAVKELKRMGYSSDFSNFVCPT